MKLSVKRDGRTFRVTGAAVEDVYKRQLITLRQYQKSGLGSNGKFIARFEAYNFAFLVVVSLFEVFVMGIR